MSSETLQRGEEVGRRRRWLGTVEDGLGASGMSWVRRADR